MRNALALVTLIILLLQAAASVAYADSPAAPKDYTKVTEGGQYVFVMLAIDDKSAYNQRGSIWRDNEIRGKYPQSGLYYNGGSNTPLWTVDWYSFDVEVSSDGHHLVKYGPWPTTANYGELALAFYEDGREIASYRVYQLVTIPFLLPASVSHYQWRAYSHFDDQSSRLTVQTELWDKYVFDVKSGTITEGVSLPVVPKCFVLLIGLAATWFGIRFLRKTQGSPHVTES